MFIRGLPRFFLLEYGRTLLFLPVHIFTGFPARETDCLFSVYLDNETFLSIIFMLMLPVLAYLVATVLANSHGFFFSGFSVEIIILRSVGQPSSLSFLILEGCLERSLIPEQSSG